MECASITLYPIDTLSEVTWSRCYSSFDLKDFPAEEDTIYYNWFEILAHQSLEVTCGSLYFKKAGWKGEFHKDHFYTGEAACVIL